MYDIPILLICFKRYDKTLEVFKSIRNVRPTKLYISIDGPRNIIEEDAVNKTASIFESVDWDCEVKIKRNKCNQGCKYSVYNAVNWFFSFEDMGIILEDDIVPFFDFYEYIRELLNKYKDDDRIGCISGWSYFYSKVPENYNYSYYFSHIQSSWGWATWKNRWKDCDIELKNTDWDVIEQILINDNIKRNIIDYYKQIFYNNYVLSSTWDYQFLFSVLMFHNRYCIQPMYRFVKNIGAGRDATHPTDSDQNKSEGISTNYKIIHPLKVEYLSWLDNERNKQTMEHL